MGYVVGVSFTLSSSRFNIWLTRFLSQYYGAQEASSLVGDL